MLGCGVSPRFSGTARSGLRGATDLGRDPEVVLRVDREAPSGALQRLGVDEQHPDRIGLGHRLLRSTPCTPLWKRMVGNVAAIENPTPGTSVAVTVPPKSSALARISLMPGPVSSSVSALRGSSTV